MRSTSASVGSRRPVDAADRAATARSARPSPGLAGSSTGIDGRGLGVGGHCAGGQAVSAVAARRRPQVGRRRVEERIIRCRRVGYRVGQHGDAPHQGLALVDVGVWVAGGSEEVVELPAALQGVVDVATRAATRGWPGGASARSAPRSSASRGSRPW